MNLDRGRGAGPAGAFCAVGDTALVRDVLYFGRNTPGGTQLSDSAWQRRCSRCCTTATRVPTQLVVEAIGEYKRRFAQEAVLRERMMTCSRF